MSAENSPEKNAALLLESLSGSAFFFGAFAILKSGLMVWHSEVMFVKKVESLC